MTSGQVCFSGSQQTGKNGYGGKRMTVLLDLVVIVILTTVDGESCQYILYF